MSGKAPARLIVEADGGSRGNPGPAAFGALVRDADGGQVLFEVGETLGTTTNNVAEYRGLLAGLGAARELNPNAAVEVRLDSKLVVEQMSGRWRIKNPQLHDIAAEAGRVFPPGQVTYTWVPRAANVAADALVNAALDGAPMRRFLEVDVTAAARPRNRFPAWSGDEMGRPTRLYLVRHGQTPSTVARLFSGGSVDGPSLNADGLGEARRAGAFIAAQAEAADPAGSGPIDAVLASPMVRTRETAGAIADALGLDVRTDDAWKEVDFGAWESLNLAEISERFPDDIAQWWHSTATAPPGGESLDDLTRRIVVARDSVVEAHQGSSVVVVTHSMPIRALVRSALEAGPSAMFRLQPAPGSITLLDVFADGTQVVTSLNIRP